MKKNIFKITVVLGSLFSLLACNKFLDELPDNRTDIDTPEKIQELLVSAYPQTLYMDVCETLSDNAGDKTNLAESSKLNTDLYQWGVNNEVQGQDTPTDYWQACYAAIAAANQALESIQNLGGGNQLNYLKGEALVARAYSHFMLAYLWCKPYNPNTAANDLGLPYVEKVEKKVFETYTRISLKEYYDRIERDLTQGIPLIQNSRYIQPKYHFTTQAAHAFASRFYLMKGEWANVITHADAALGNDPYSNLRNLKQQKPLTYNQKQVQYPSAEEPANILVVGARSSYNQNLAYNKYGLTLQLSELLSLGELHPFEGEWSRSFYGRDDYRNYPKFNEHIRYTNISSGTGYRYNMAVLFSYDEVYLNRLEAYAMIGEKDKYLVDIVRFLIPKSQTDYSILIGYLDEATMDQLYNNKGTDLAPYYEMTAQQRAWVQAVLDMRRVEFVFEGLRWLDNKRFGMKITHPKGSEILTLEKNDPRRELQIPEDAIVNGLTPNPR